MRLKIVFYFIILVILLLLGRIYFLSIKSNVYYQELSQQNYIKEIKLKPTRGIIKDRNEIPIAINKLGFNISIAPHMKNKKNIKRLQYLISIIVNNFPEFDAQKLLKKYKKNDSPYSHEYVEIANYIEYDKMFLKYALFNSIDDFKVEPVDKRFYPFGSIGAHIIGYTGKASKKNMENNEISKYTKIIGKSGLEQFYNNKLQGKLGYKKIIVNALNKEIDVIEENLSLEDNDISTTIDINLQKSIHEIFTQGNDSNQSGVVIVMDVRNGEILAAGSFPEYDSNIFVNGISHKNWNELINNFNHPFTNKIINGLYPPGSVIKMGVALSFLKNSLNEKSSIYCSGATKIGNRKFRCWKHRGHKTVKIDKAIRESCDDYFYKGALKVGIDNIAQTMDKFGFGKKTNIDLSNEFIGVNPSRAWKKRKYNQSWFQGDTANSSIGQGFSLVTPIQVAVYTAALATSKVIRPHFVKNHTSNESKDLNISQKDLKIIKNGMFEVINHPKGTASKYITNDIKIAGKTGTAQVVSIPKSEKIRMLESELEYYQRSHAWLTTYAPFENPQYVVTVLVEHGGHGGSAGGQIVSKIYDKLIELNYIKK